MTIKEILETIKGMHIIDIFNAILLFMFILALIATWIVIHTSIGDGNV